MNLVNLYLRTVNSQLVLRLDKYGYYIIALQIGYGPEVKALTIESLAQYLKLSKTEAYQLLARYDIDYRKEEYMLQFFSRIDCAKAITVFNMYRGVSS